MNRRALPLFVSLIAVLLVTGCNSTGEGKSSSEPVAQQSAEVITLREVAGVPDEVSRLIRGWQTDVMTLVAEEGRGKRKGARIAALGVNGVGAALIKAMMSSTFDRATARPSRM